MAISPVNDRATPLDLPGAAASQSKIERVSTAASAPVTPEKPATAAGAAAVVPLERPTDVTLRRDTDGRVYYVVSDAKSGEEIIEVPPKALRDVSQGIEDYLKEAQSKVSSHVKVKA